MPEPPASDPAERRDLRSEFSRIAREKIKAGALQCFETYGFRATTIRQIARAAGTTPTTFYQYFKGKAEVVVELGHENEPALLQIAAELNAALATPSRAAVRAWLDRYAALWAERHPIFDAYWEALGEQRVAADLFPFAGAMAERMPNVLDRFPEADRERMKIRISLLFFYMYQTIYISYSTRNEARLDEILEGLTDVMWCSLAPWTRGEGLGGPD